MSLRVGHLDLRVRSKGCLACIRLKKKCDQKKPHCQRCIAAKRQCPGYRAPTTTFIVENGEKRLFTSTGTLHCSTPHTDWLQNALGHYFHHFVTDVRDGLPGKHERLCYLYTSYPEANFLQSALQAVAMANLARVKRMSTEHWIKAQTLYGDALCQFRRALAGSIEAGSESALLTTELLIEYDVVVGQALTPVASLHRQGMLLLLHKQLLCSFKQSCSITTCVFVNFLLQSIGQKGIPIPSFPLRLDPSPTTAGGILFKLIGLLYEAVCICRTPLAEIESLEDESAYIRQLQHLNQDLLDWETTVLNDWKYSTQIRSMNSSELDYPPTYLTFPSINSMMLWHSFWITRLDVLMCLYKLRLPPPEALVIQLDMLVLVDAICSAVACVTDQGTDDTVTPQIHGRILSSVFASRSLSMAWCVPNLSNTKKEWIYKQLDFIRMQKGIGCAGLPSLDKNT